MKAAKLLLSAAASAGFAATAVGQVGPAQFPGMAGPLSTVPPPLATAPPFPNPQGIAPQAAVPDGPTIWSKLGISQAQREFCRRKLCKTPFGRLAGRIQNPMSNLTGGLIPPFCPTTPTLAELQDPGVIGAAAKVKQDQAGAAERIEAIKKLATVDCTYWPEAEEALIGALRTDRNECVRYEAALALASGCCCTCKVIVALSHTVCCSDKDGGFMEKSARVRTAAAVALEQCLTINCACLADLPEDETTDPNKKKGSPEGSGSPEGGATNMTTSARFDAPAVAKPGPTEMKKSAEPLSFKEYYAAVPSVPKNQVLDNARRSLEIGRRIGTSITMEVIPADYAAAGYATPEEAQQMSHKQTNLWDMLTRTNNEQPKVYLPTRMPQTPAVATAAPPTVVTTVVKSTPVPMEVSKPVAAAMPTPRVTSQPTRFVPPSTSPARLTSGSSSFLTPGPKPMASTPKPTPAMVAPVQATQPTTVITTTPVPMPMPPTVTVTPVGPPAVKIEPVKPALPPIEPIATTPVAAPRMIPPMATQPLVTPTARPQQMMDPVPLNMPRSTSQQPYGPVANPYGFR